MSKLVKKIKINTTLTLVTGLHIGGSADSVEIGGIDNPVIKLATKDNQPYIPGSSLKGKMRCLLEQIDGSANIGDSPAVVKLFGSADTNNPRPSRVIVRDAILTPESVKMLSLSDYMDLPYTESKYENTIHRVHGTASNPRQTERVPAGAEFAVEFVINVFDGEDEPSSEELLSLFKKGLNVLQNDYLGGSGSRGYGQIRFGELHTEEISNDTNWK